MTKPLKKLVRLIQRNSSKRRVNGFRLFFAYA